MRLGRSPAEGNGHPLQYPCLENSKDRGAWRATVHGMAQSQTRLRVCTAQHPAHHLVNVEYMVALLRVCWALCHTWASVVLLGITALNRESVLLVLTPACHFRKAGTFLQHFTAVLCALKASFERPDSDFQASSFHSPAGAQVAWGHPPAIHSSPVKFKIKDCFFLL